MPSGPIAADDYIDDPNRTTEEVQDALNELFDFVRAIKTELSTLSLTTFGEAAVRGVGSGAGQLPDTEELNSRLGTSVNLGTAATKNMGAGGGLDSDLLDGKEGSEYLAKDEFSPFSLTVVWTGSKDYVPITDLSIQGAGFYVLETTLYRYLIWVDGLYNRYGGSSIITGTDSNAAAQYDSGSGFAVWGNEVSPIEFSRYTLTKIYKLM